MPCSFHSPREKEKMAISVNKASQEEPSPASATEESSLGARETGETRLLQWQCGWQWNDGVELSVVLLDLDENGSLKKAQEAFPRARKEDLAGAVLHTPEQAARIGQAALDSVGCVSLPEPEKSAGFAALKAVRKRNNGIFNALSDFRKDLPKRWRDWDTKAPGEPHARRIAVCAEQSVMDFDAKADAQKMCAAATAEMKAIAEESFGPRAVLLSLSISTEHGEPAAVDEAVAAAIERWELDFAVNDATQKTLAGSSGAVSSLSQKNGGMRL